MRESMMHIIGYHGTKKDNAQNIIRNGFDISKCTPRNDHWLGSGIYFFTDSEFACWWASIRSTNGAVIQCDIKCDDTNYLDLDIIKNRMKFDMKCKEYRCTYNMKYDSVEVLRSTLVDLYKKEFNYFVVSKFFTEIGQSFFRYNPLHKKLKNVLPVLQRQVCVSECSLISNMRCIKGGINVNERNGKGSI